MEHGTFQKEGRKESMRKSELKRVWRCVPKLETRPVWLEHREQRTGGQGGADKDQHAGYIQ